MSKACSSQLQGWVTEVLGAEMADRAPEVFEALQKEMCTDLPMLRDCWEEIRLRLPGVPRKLISDALTKEEQQKVIFEPLVQGKLWVKAFFLGLPGVILTCVLGVFKDTGAEEEGLEPEALETKGWYMYWGPLMLFFFLQMVAVAKLAPIIGYDMIQNRSLGISLRDAMRNNMSNQAIVGTLLLTVAWAMLQADPPVTEGVNSYEGLFISQWYEGLLLITTAQLVIGVMTCAFTVLYVEPLDDLAALKFVGDNFLYFGEPLAVMLLSLFNTCIATILWVFGAYGFGMGIVAVFVFSYCVLRTVVIYMYLGFWQNPFLSKEEKGKRDAIKSVIMTATGGRKTSA
mmetsp:Transcript_68555/g.200560  ORF Transcript_68555/g.200560 Transcript_68555/m.200560 type:complete len:343 (+) Transcript_68555:115-1143(+)